MWTAIFLIVALSLVASTIKHGMDRRRVENSDELSKLRQQMEQSEQHLRQRIETLEKIITDDKDDLSRQFEELGRTG